MILISPFLYFGLNKIDPEINNSESKLKIERKMLLENLRDLKTDYETKKFSESDFHSLSSDIITKLEILDKKITVKESKSLTCTCGTIDHKIHAIFCYNCGTKLKV